MKSTPPMKVEFNGVVLLPMGLLAATCLRKQTT
eukprot:CAMPEP_0174325650 /NCGR_PEP_ID=MMETSP0810-20121108/13373_1 /TAXON_ID=73025 ORGANISM="Eutreptiella gymnastica-like, Strain CCMP1594" /NCGR_SAMPLE_ID=MMETSP0810 /ASSEMBLY_ACC=CAM_ASM_000659 /LENGTH=32 /DNA_ID= /DNA_START= /DNA_END= /DNA_ORIENTATION=